MKRPFRLSPVAAMGLAGAAILAARHAIGEVRRRRVFQGKHVLVTGGSRGLGLELARQLAAHGARLSLLARDEAELARAKADIQRRTPGAEVETFRCDLVDEIACQQATADAAARLGPIDVLVNNAGIIQVGPMESMTVADYEEAMQLHFF